MEINKKKIKPSEITSETKLEYYNNNSIYEDFNTLNLSECKEIQNQYGFVASLLNASKTLKDAWYLMHKDDAFASKKDLVILNFIKKCLYIL